jgi:hypothetical protein
MAVYDECKALWERRRDDRNERIEAQRQNDPTAAPPEEWRSGWIAIETIEKGIGGGNWLVGKLDLPQDAISFLTTLRMLGQHLHDNRYRDLAAELLMSDLIDRKTGKWSYFDVNQETQLLFEQIEDMIASGVSERETLAQAIVDFDITGHSFGAVHKDLERLLKEYRKRVRQKSPKNV